MFHSNRRKLDEQRIWVMSVKQKKQQHKNRQTIILGWVGLHPYPKINLSRASPIGDSMPCPLPFAVQHIVICLCFLIKSDEKYDFDVSNFLTLGFHRVQTNSFLSNIMTNRNFQWLTWWIRRLNVIIISLVRLPMRGRKSPCTDQFPGSGRVLFLTRGSTLPGRP